MIGVHTARRGSRGGVPHGEGTATYANGGKYIGQYKDSKMHGKGTFTFANGNKYVGEFKDGKYVTNENGSGSAETNLLELVFKDGKRLRKHTHAEIMTAIDDAQLRLHGISGGKRKAADAFA